MLNTLENLVKLKNERENLHLLKDRIISLLKDKSLQGKGFRGS